MGLIHTYLELGPSLEHVNSSRVKFLVDSGAEYTVVPRAKLAQIGIKPHRRIEVMLADGSVHERDAGDAFFDYQGLRAASPVIFGEMDDEALLGAVTLESLGLLLDPLKRRIIRRQAIRM